MTRWSAITRNRARRSALAYGSRSTTAAEDNLNRLVHHERGRYSGHSVGKPSAHGVLHVLVSNDKSVSRIDKLGVTGSSPVPPTGGKPCKRMAFVVFGENTRSAHGREMVAPVSGSRHH